MLFNTLQFAVFLAIVFSLYIILRNKFRAQNLMLLVASYIFYGAWDWRFLSLLFISTVIDYFCAIKISDAPNERTRKIFIFLTVGSNLVILGFFKYFGFFVSSMTALLNHFGLNVSAPVLNIVLPVGISFYTFQSMSYTLDVYNKKLEPTRSLPDFALYVSYFPQLVAGPIERATHLLPQVLKPRIMTREGFYEGSYLIFWGLFEKVFIADNLAKIADPIFSASAPYAGINVLIGVYAFAFQILCDFDGYSNIARGLGKIMGFDIMVNFNLPYFSTNPGEFWKRWHISLSTWLKDYLYIPLGGNRHGSFMTYRNLAITMLLGGLWHGAQWTFVIWGAYHGILLIVYRLIKPLLKYLPQYGEKGGFVIKCVNMFIFFHLVCLGWLMFRAQSFGQFKDMLMSLFVNFKFVSENPLGLEIYWLCFFIALLVLIQVWQYIKNDLMVLYRSNAVIKTVVYVIMMLALTLYGVTNGQEFIYFRF